MRCHNSSRAILTPGMDHWIESILVDLMAHSCKISRPHRFVRPEVKEASWLVVDVTVLSKNRPGSVHTASLCLRSQRHCMSGLLDVLGSSPRILGNLPLVMRCSLRITSFMFCINHGKVSLDRFLLRK